MEVFENSEANDVQEYIFALQKGMKSQELIAIRKMNETNYEYFSRSFTFWRSGGRSGATELVSIYRMLSRLKKEGMMPSEVLCLMKIKD